ncbi:reverse transcriptase domain-containing protein [Streptomyces sp. MMS24-I2-30]|uniref:reverse transcriptase domain-containing protein n=1 Tax=Streptomyces sp. MMS24-I2-30 TaxID=3351564 RepID=UPI003896A5F1
MRRGGWAHRRPIGPGGGGAAVVLGAGESPEQGEGRQQLREGMETAMPEDAPPNGGAPAGSALLGSSGRVLEMQTKLHRWAVADPGRRFDDLFNFVHDPATLMLAFDRVAGNQGSRTAGVDGLTVADVESAPGVPGFLDALRADLKSGSFRPLPVRERKIPKPGGSGKVRSLGIPSVADRTVQAALKLVPEPIFEADFLPVAYGFRPKRRAQDAIAEIQRFGTKGYRWVLDADIEAAFDNVSHRAVMDAVRVWVKDKRVLALVKAFLKSGILAEDGRRRDTHTGTPQGGILSPLIFNIALSALDEHLHRDWKPGGRLRGKRTRIVELCTSPPDGATVVCADELGPVIPRTFPPAPGRSPDGHRVKNEIDYSVDRRRPGSTAPYASVTLKPSR